MSSLNEDGEKLAEIIYSKLKESENGELSFNEIMDIYDSFGEPIFRKTEFVCWGIVYAKADVKHERDEKGYKYIKLKS